MSETHTRLAWTGLGWSSRRLGAQRRPWVESVVRGDGVGVCESLRVKQALALAFFKISNSCACCRARAHTWCSPAAVSRSRAVPKGAAADVWAAFCHW